jgi:hypothetical protein
MVLAGLGHGIGATALFHGVLGEAANVVTDNLLSADSENPLSAPWIFALPDAVYGSIGSHAENDVDCGMWRDGLNARLKGAHRFRYFRRNRLG